MRLKAFRVQKYKTILDTGTVELRPDVTALIGKNESGKSAILQAIWKSKNVAEGKHDYLYDLPKERFTADRGTDPVVTELCFTLEPSDKEAFQESIGLAAPSEVQIATTYEGKQSCSFELVQRTVDTDGIGELLEALEAELGSTADAEPDSKRQAAVGAIPAVRAAIADPVDGPKLRSAVGTLKNTLTPLRDQLKQADERLAVLDSAGEYKTPDEDRKAAVELLLGRLPNFIYFEDYGRLETRINLPAFIQQKKSKPTDSRVRTQVALFEWARLSPEELQKLGRAPDPGEAQESVDRRKEERSTLLESASYSVTGEWMNWWDQRRHQLEIGADGDDLVLKVSDNENPWKVAFHERSKGFQWFFSFYLNLLVESEKSHHGAILLLDEPGLHLHIRAQQKLLAFFQKISEKNQIVYTSHSPFMVDPDNLDNVRTVFLKKDEEGERFHTHVAMGTEPGTDHDTVLPLQAALGYDLAQTLFLGKRGTLVVEGFSDYMLLKYLSQQLADAGRDCVPEDVEVLFAGGTSHMLPLVSLFVRPDQDERRLVVLLDADKPGQDKAKQLRRDLLTSAGAVALLSEADILGVADSQVEDIVERKELLEAVKLIHGKKPTLPSPEPGTNVPFLSAVYDANGWGPLDRTKKAKVVLAVIDIWRGGTKPSDVTLGNAERVFRGLKGRFT